ncbi:MAG: ABC transporter permease [Rhizobiaceae bacterium]
MSFDTSFWAESIQSAYSGEHTFFEGTKLAWAALAIAFTAVFVVTGNLRGYSLDSLIPTVLSGTTVLALVGAGQALVVLAGRIDLSVGGTMGLASAVMAYSATAFADNGLLPVALGIGTGAACGLANALLTSRITAPAFLVTVVTGQLSMTLTWLIASGGISISGPQSDLLVVFSTEIGLYSGVTFGVAFAVVMVLGLGSALVRTSFGRRIFAAGEERDSDEHSGIRALTYVLSGILSALAAWVLIGERHFAASGQEFSYTTSSVAAVVLGGICIYGGFGSMAGMLLGSLAISMVPIIMFELDDGLHFQGLVVPSLLLISLIIASRRKPHAG